MGYLYSSTLAIEGVLDIIFHKSTVFVSHKALSGRQLTTAFCQHGEERKQHRHVEEEAQKGTEAVTKAYGTLLAPVTLFKYLRRIISETDDEWIAVVRNL